MNAAAPPVQTWTAALEGLAARVPDLAMTIGGHGWPVALAAAVAGIALVAVGSRLGPVLCCAASALVGWVAGTQLYGMAGGWHVPTATVGYTSAAVLGLASLFAPVIYPMGLGAIAGALLGLRFGVGGGGAVGAAVGALILAGIFVLLRRFVIAATASIAGACVFVAALIALSVRFPWLEALTQRPPLLVGLGAVLAIAGTAFQFGIQPRDVPNLVRDRRPRALARD